MAKNVTRSKNKDSKLNELSIKKHQPARQEMTEQYNNHTQNFMIVSLDTVRMGQTCVGLAEQMAEEKHIESLVGKLATEEIWEDKAVEG
jgi:hypothetical protein